MKITSALKCHLRFQGNSLIDNLLALIWTINKLGYYRTKRRSRLLRSTNQVKMFAAVYF